MNFFEYFFNHKKTVERMFDQLDALNNIIAERTQNAEVLGEQLKNLETRITEIMTNYPELSEEEAIKKYFTTLKEENGSLEADIASKKTELESLRKKLKILSNLSNINAERKKLEADVASLKKYKSKHIKPEDVIIAFYQVKEAFACCNAFVYCDDTTYTDKEDEQEYPGKIYKSLNGNRIIGFTYDFKTPLFTSVPDGNNDINTSPRLWFSFTDICIEIGSNAYLKSTLTPEEINKVLKGFLALYDFWYNTEENKVTLRLKKES